MAAPSCKCKTVWFWSIFRYDLTGLLELDGAIFVDMCDSRTGDISGRHLNPAGLEDGSIRGHCETSTPHISFTRETMINGVTYTYSYSGDIDDSGAFPVIVRGRFKKVEKVDTVKVSNDDGDWTAQGPVTLVTESWERK